jgi:glycosyltransferase involved in cell wall biosynthesis
MVLTKQTKKRIGKSFNIGCFVKSLPDPIEEDIEQVNKETARKELGIDVEERIFLFFGQMRQEKGPVKLLESLYKVEEEVCVVFAGRSGVVDSDKLRYYSEQLNNVRIVNRLGFIDEQNVCKYFAAADVVMLPYRKGYVGTSGILQQAAASGTPVITTDVGQIGAIVERWNLGEVVDSSSKKDLCYAIEEYAQKSIRKLSLNNENYVESNSSSAFGERVYETYKKLACRK